MVAPSGSATPYVAFGRGRATAVTPALALAAINARVEGAGISPVIVENVSTGVGMDVKVIPAPLLLSTILRR